MFCQLLEDFMEYTKFLVFKFFIFFDNFFFPQGDYDETMKDDNKWFETEIQCHTIYYQGMSCSQIQMAKYTGNVGFIATTGEHIVCPKSIDIIHNPFIGQEIDEVELHCKLYSFYDCIIKLPRIIETYLFNWYNGIIITSSENMINNGTVKYHSIHISKVCIGQEGDIISHSKKMKKFQEQNNNEKSNIILFGVSRGAATTVNALSTNNYDTSKIKLVILEGCPSNINNILKQTYCAPIYQLIYNVLLPKFTSYKRDAPTVLDNIDKFPPNIPVIFITSKKDNVVPYDTVVELANKLAKRNNSVYLLLLEKSSHPNYIFDDETDRKKYETLIHAAYEKYDLPFIPELAKYGKTLLEKCII